MSIQATGLRTAGKTKLLLAAVMAAGAAMALSSTSAKATTTTYTWTGAKSNLFSNTGNWSPALSAGNSIPGIAAFGSSTGGFTTLVDDMGNAANPYDITFASGAPALTIEGGTAGTNGELATTNAVQILGGGNSLTNNSTNAQTFAAGLRITFFDYLSPSASNANVTVTGNFNFDGGIGFSNAKNGGGTNSYPPNLTFAAGSTTTVSGVISGGSTTGTAYGNITADGTSLQLSGANTYVGSTTLNAGVLDLENGTNGSATGNGAVTLNAGTLEGNGSSSGATTIAGTGVTLSPTGTLSLGSLDFSGNAATLAFTLGTSSSLIKTGALSLANGSSVNVTAGTGFGVGTYQLIDYSSLANAADLGTWTLGNVPAGFNYQLTNNAATSSIDLTVTATPEPAAFGFFGLGAVGLLLARRKRA